MPSSLAVIHSSTLGFSPHPPVSVYGTGRIALDAGWIFLPVWLPALSGCPKTPGTVGFQSPYVLQRAIPSARGSVTPGSPSNPQCGLRNIDRINITLPFRDRLSTRLTLRRLTSLRKPWVFGVILSIIIIVTYAYIFFSSRSSTSHGAPSRLTGMLPYH